MKQPSYVVSFQKESFRKGIRYHWMICGKDNADEMISWGYAPTQEAAEAAARNEVQDLTSGLTRGGRVLSAPKPFTRHQC